MDLPETRALELVASALSEEYGVRVIASGLRVMTRRDANNIPVITIPAIPLRDENYRLLIRGYIDHAVGHVRFGADQLLADAIYSAGEISGALNAVVSIYEDLRIDRIMGECFFGCGRNLRKLAIYLYGAPSLPDAQVLRDKFAGGIMAPKEMPWHIWNSALQFLLYYCRASYLPQLEQWLAKWRDTLEILAPGLPGQLIRILDNVLDEGMTYEKNLQCGRQTVAVIRDWFFDQWGSDVSPWPVAAMQELPWLLRNGGESRDLMDMGNLAAARLDKLLNELNDGTQAVAECKWHKRGSDIWQQRLLPLSEDEIKESLQTAAKMSAQMQALLQSHVLNREGPYRQGKLHTRNLHKLFIGRSDLFRRNNERREIDTEIVCCIDMSGSMRFDEKAQMASCSLYAVAESLAHIQGLRMSIMGFYDNNMVEMHVSPAPLGNRLKIVPDGGTLCGVAVRAAARLFGNGGKKRRIIMLITDGDANDPEYFNDAIKDLSKAGIEILGIGIHDAHILEYLPTERCCVITDLGTLAGSILSMLRKRIGIRP